MFPSSTCFIVSTCFIFFFTPIYNLFCSVFYFVANITYIFQIIKCTLHVIAGAYIVLMLHVIAGAYIVLM